MRNIIYLFLLLLPSLALAQKKLTIVTHDFPPFSYQHAGQYRGMSVEILYAVLGKMQFKQFEIVSLPWKRALKEGQKPGHLLFPFARKPNREIRFDWVAKAGPRKISLFKLRDRRDIQTARENAFYKEFSVASLIGTAYSKALEDQGFKKRHQSNTPMQSVLMLARERVDLVLEDDAVFYHSLKSYNAGLFDHEKISAEKVTHFSKASDRWFAFGKGSDQQLVEGFKLAYQQLKAQGVIEGITKRYF